MKLRLAKPAREAIGTRLRELRRFHNLEQTELAQMAGLSQAIISQYEKGLTEVSLAFITFLTERFRMSTEWLISGKPALLPPSEPRASRSVPKGGPEPRTEKIRSSPFLQVPVVAPHIAAQPGAVRSDTIQGWLPVSAGHVAGRGNLVAVDVRAEWVLNMAPPFRAGSCAILDRGDKKIHPNRYYAVFGNVREKPSITAIRRLNLSGSRLWLLEDRPSHTFEFIDLSPRLDLDRVVIGRLVWISQRL